MFWNRNRKQQTKRRRRTLRTEMLETRLPLASDFGGVTGTVYNDLTGDGLSGDDLPPTAAVTLHLYRDGGDGVLSSSGGGTAGDDTFLTTTTTDASGDYAFNRLTAGTYFVERILPAGFIERSGENAVQFTITPADASGATSGTLVDDFLAGTQSLEATSATTTDESYFSDGTILGGERDLLLTYTSGLRVNLDTIPASGLISYSSASGAFGGFEIVYDGVDGSTNINATGLGGANLDDNGSAEFLQLMLGADAAGVPITLTIFSDDANFSTFSTTVPQTADGVATDELLIPLNSFVDTGNGADFSNVGAIRVAITGSAAFDSQVAVIGTLGQTNQTANFAMFEPLTLGNLVFNDLNGNSVFDSGTDVGIENVDLTLYEDTDGNGAFTPGTDTQVATTSTNASGIYTFTNLVAGSYIVQVDESNFSTGNPLASFLSSPGNPDPNNDVDNDDNGVLLAGQGAVSLAVALAANTEPGDDGDTDTDTNLSVDFGFFASADLSITKADSPDPVVAGNTLTYTLTVLNDGPVDATGVTVVDTLPTNVQIDTITTSQGTSTTNGNIVTVDLGDIANGGNATIVITVIVDADVTSQISNTATVSGDQPDDDPNNNTANAPTDVNAEVDLVITKVDQTDPASAGGTLEYVITVTNNGPSVATNVVVTDTLPAGLTYDTGTATQGSVSNVGQAITGLLGTLSSGASATITIGTNVASSASGTISNTATVTSDGTETTPADNTTTEQTVIGRTVDLAVTKQDSVDPVVPGNQMTYTLVVTNNGPSDASGVLLTDTLPAGLTLASNTTTQGSVSNTGNTVTANLGTLASGATATVTLTVNVASSVAAAFTNTATVTANETDSVPANNTASEPTEVDRQFDLRVEKSDSADPATPGGTLTYTIDVFNDGPSDATAITLTDTLPAGVTFASGSNGLTANGSVVTANIASLASGASAQFTVTVNIDPTANGTLSNTATVSTTTGTELDVTNNSDTETTALTPSIDLSITKTDSSTTVRNGETLTYTIVVTNSGPSTATGVTLSDPFPSGVTVTSVTSTVGTVTNTGNNVSGTIGTLAPGASATITVLATVDSGTTGTIINTATVSATQTETNTANNSASDTTTVDPVDGTLAGTVYFDANRNGQQDTGEVGIADVLITLTGTDLMGNAVNRTETTDANGDYLFDNLAAGTYQLSETQPTGFDDGEEESNPSLQTNVMNDVFASINFSPSDQGVDFNFGEERSFSKRRFLASAL
ncbi:Large cysteine-rich periplasmic protein OmcB precursor [Rosistilla ulvae]|uniref:Large cysteine-rich periplasmic protein OmcB n=1 Tax=Rosistilla ulvae TaxID=1930277 RepID=A0A517M7H6_9BACT|nr:SdrD B-like domain-containing protein [Rosistilla ulvae]QDS90823.1 Large cysteine-rich periplasmic protein OmcB precursor [Rosistilla ulvae]